MNQTFDSKLTDLKTGVELVTKVLGRLTKDLESIVTDKSVPVLKRWDIWCNAPDSLKKHDSWYMEIYHKGINLFENDEYNRYETVYVADLVNNYIEGSWSDLIYDTTGGYEVKSDDWLPDGFEIVLEELMAKNVGSFRYDW